MSAVTLIAENDPLHGICMWCDLSIWRRGVAARWAWRTVLEDSAVCDSSPDQEHHPI